MPPIPVFIPDPPPPPLQVLAAEVDAHVAAGKLTRGEADRLMRLVHAATRKGTS